MAVELMKWEMRDPFLVLMSKQQAAINRSCTGCANTKEVSNPFGGTATRCLKGRPYGKKCNQYKGEQ